MSGGSVKYFLTNALLNFTNSIPIDKSFDVKNILYLFKTYKSSKLVNIQKNQGSVIHGNIEYINSNNNTWPADYLADNKGDKRSNFVRFLSDKMVQNQ